MNKSIVLASFLASAMTVKAQYPVIPPAIEAKADSALAEVERQSDLQFAKVMPIVEAEAKNGKPFIPWASKPSDLPQAKIAAFPGAEGGGAFTAGGRGGKVYVVTNLNDSGPGSFRWACEQGGARVVVFNVAGIIQLKTPVIIRAPYITIAGQSAPGDGVCVAGESVWINTHDVVIRYMRFRRGATDVTRRDDAIGGNPVGNIMIDHVSASWGLDENMSIYRHVYDKKDGSKPQKLPTVNVTIQNSIFSEALDTYNHAFGSTIGGLNSTFMRNLWANNIARNPSVGMYGDFGFVNNTIFNWWNRSADGGDNDSFYSFINNYYKPGPITPAGQPISYRILKPESGRDKRFVNTFGKAYVTGNIVEGNDKVSKNNWDGGVQPETKGDLNKLLDSMRVNKPLPMAKVSVMDTKEAYDYVLANAGASLPKRDAVDARVVETVRTGKIKYVEGGKTGVGKEFIKRRLPVDSYKQGIITDVSQVGGYPTYSGKPYKDSDNDGMPDDYEKKMGLNPKDPNDAQVISKNGYSNIENYLNSLVDVKTVAPSTK
ncbi:polysaccharide lyase [Pelobium manganitolerans]|uniref:Polysaccharide lyase n=1 Tax=Pelobium manganitolerans TaxID=1842495 RepID=A0A419SB38_9SPHI|nr:polysaccharide lyase [Pelobium manganitolerans]RKD19650.1 polysaccharide lyase [Pelobium manganitolerans]